MFPERLDGATHHIPINMASPGRVVVVANQKGGVGKTTTAINLGTALAATGKRVLILDFDPQGNASTGLGIDKGDRGRGTYGLLNGMRASEVARKTIVPGLFLVPSTPDLAGAELELIHVDRPHFRLREALGLGAPGSAESNGVRTEYDYVLIDCPPALGLLTVNGLVAADSLLVPLQCEFFALEGLSQLLRTVERVRSSFNPRLAIQGVVLTMYDTRNNLSTQVAADVRAHFGTMVYDTVIPRNVRVSEAPSFGRPVLLYDVRCAGAQAYVHLAGEVLKRERCQAPAMRAAS